MLENDADHATSAGARDRARSGYRHRGRLPAGGDVRPRGSIANSTIRRQRRKIRALLLRAGRGAVP